MHVGRRLVLAARPHRHQYGHQAVEIAYALAYARLIGVPVLFIWPKQVPSDALCEFVADDVRILSSRRERLIPRAAATLAAARHWRRRVANAVRDAAAAEIRRRLKRGRLIPRAARSGLKRALGALKDQLAESKLQRTRGAGTRVTYNRRRLVAKPLETRLTVPAERHAQDCATRFGIEPATPLVCLHVRERGFKLGGEIQDKNPDAWDDSVRNARIENQIPAVDYLVARGYTVVRMGDPSMTPVSRRGLIDLATSPERDDRLELWCLLRSRFLLSAESGPLSVSYLTNTPALTVNATDPIGAFPTRQDGLYRLKTVLDRDTGEPISPLELLTEDRLTHLRNPERHRFVENTPQEILEAVEEMLDLLDHGTPESPAQSRYRELVTEAAVSYGHLPYVFKHGADRGYIGGGRLVRAQAEPLFESGAQEAQPATQRT